MSAALLTMIDEKDREIERLLSRITNLESVVAQLTPVRNAAADSLLQDMRSHPVGVRPLTTNEAS